MMRRWFGAHETPVLSSALETNEAVPVEQDPADRLDSWKEIAAYLNRSVLTAQRWEKNEALPVRRHAHGKQDSVYAYKSELDCWWHKRGDSTRAQEFTRAAQSVGARRRFATAPARRRILASAAGFVLVATAFVAWQSRAAKIRWAQHQALPALEQFTNLTYSSREFFRAYALASAAERFIPGDARLEKVWPAISRKLDITTDPPGADVSAMSFDSTETLDFGVSPLKGVRVPRGFLRWRARKDGYESAEGVYEPWIGSLHIVLDRVGTVPAGMVRATGGKFELALSHLTWKPPFEVGDYWIDRHEVTNREFRRFVDAGGYSSPTYWKQAFEKDGRRLSVDEAMQLFRDRTGRLGPATWEAGEFPQGKGDYPVTGVSWFEAMAYAEFAGKSLPTIFHWVRAAGISANSEIVPLSNFSGSGLASVERYRGVSAVGAYDMAGNAKEWCFNATAPGRFILGGAWDEPLYMFSEADGQSPFARADNFGFRLVKYITPPAPSLLGEIDYPRRDFNKEKPVSDAVFKLIRGLYSYDKSQLDATVDSVDDSNEQWRKERISFGAAYGGERVTAYVFLPRHASPPYQTVVYFPGSDGIKVRSSAQLKPPLDGATIKSGRALVFPIYKSLFERGDALDSDYPVQTDFYREHMLDWYKDFERTLDYVETRHDLDASRVAYLGFSWGARLGPIFIALDPRIRTAVLLSGGLKFAQTFPEADPFNFAQRVSVPVLMLNGRYDYFFPVETSQRPLFRLLGTNAANKRHVVLNVGHALPPTPASKATLEWLDRYLGRVQP